MAVAAVPVLVVEATVDAAAHTISAAAGEAVAAAGLAARDRQSAFAPADPVVAFGVHALVAQNHPLPSTLPSRLVLRGLTHRVESAKMMHFSALRSDSQVCLFRPEKLLSYVKMHSKQLCEG